VIAAWGCLETGFFEEAREEVLVGWLAADGVDEQAAVVARFRSL